MTRKISRAELKYVTENLKAASEGGARTFAAVKKIGKWVAALDKLTADVQAEFMLLSKGHMKKDEQGVPVPGDQPGSVRIEMTEEFMAQLDRFNAEPVELPDLPLLDDADFEQFTVLPTPAQYAALQLIAQG